MTIEFRPKKAFVELSLRVELSSLATLLAFIIVMIAGFAQPVRAAEARQIVGIISGSISGTYARFAHEMAVTLDSDELRVLPMLGKGSRQNIEDLMTINGIDVAIVQSDVLDYFRSSGEIPDVVEGIRYIAKLYDEEVHVVVRKNLTSVKELEGALVSVGPAGGGTEMTAEILFDALGIGIEKVNLANADAIEQLEAEVIDAAVFVLGKPGAIISGIAADSALALLPIELPKTVQGSYFETEFAAADYPNLVPEGERVPTVAVGAVLAVFNWREGSRRYDAVATFCRDLAAALPVLQSGATYHPKWRDVDLTVEVPGWQRFGAMAALVPR